MPVIDQEFIPPKKEQLNIRLDPEVIGMLNRYCVFLNSGQQHVVEQALRYMFAKDRDFQTWLNTQETTGDEEDEETARGQVTIEADSREEPMLRRLTEARTVTCYCVADLSGLPVGF